MDFAAYADAHHEARLVELSAPLAVKMPDCDARERVQRLRAWGRYLRGMDGATMKEQQFIAAYEAQWQALEQFFFPAGTRAAAARAVA